jgi:cytoskeletal protein RodZ
VFQQNQSANLPIDDPTAKATPSKQAATSSSSDAQPIQNQSSDGKARDSAVTSPVQSIIQDQVLPVQNQQKYPALRDQDGKLAVWDLPRDHFETNISNFFDPVREEVPEVKYQQSYQATFGGTSGTVHMTWEGVVFVHFIHGSKNFERVRISPTHAHMVILTVKRPPIPPQRPNPIPPQKSAQQPILGMSVQTTPLQQPTLGMLI